MTKVYWLHVDASGAEIVYAEEPTNVPTLRVEVVDGRKGLERTWTKLVYPDDWYGAEKLVRPRGEGWSLEGTLIAGSVSWTRRRGRKAKAK
jgi:hypothetical protein